MFVTTLRCTELSPRNQQQAFCTASNGLSTLVKKSEEDGNYSFIQQCFGLKKKDHQARSDKTKKEDKSDRDTVFFVCLCVYLFPFWALFSALLSMKLLREVMHKTIIVLS